MSADELINVVHDFNEQIYQNNPKLSEEYGIYFTYTSNGYSYGIEFMGCMIWDSNNDDRDWDDKKRDYSITVRDYVIERVKGISLGFELK